VSLPSSYRSRRGHVHLLRVLPLVGCRSKTPTAPAKALRADASIPREYSGGNERGPAQRGRSHGAAAGDDGHDGGHDHGGHRTIDFAGACPSQRLSGGGGGCPGRRHPTARMGPVGERARMLTVKIRQPSHEFTFGVGMSFIPYPLVLTPVV
jgi:hypothetical protein